HPAARAVGHRRRVGGLRGARPAALAVHRQRGDGRVPRHRAGVTRRPLRVGHRRGPQPTLGPVTTILVTGGAGFIGSNLADRLLAEDPRVISVDDLSTGRIANLGDARSYGKAYTFFNMDVRAGGLLSLFERHRPEI